MSNNTSLRDHARSWAHSLGFRLFKPENLDAAADRYERRVNELFTDFIKRDFDLLKSLNDAEARQVEAKGDLSGSERLSPHKTFDAEIILRRSDSKEEIGRLPLEGIPTMKAFEEFKQLLNHVCRNVPEAIAIWKAVDVHTSWAIAKGDYDKAARDREHYYERFRSDVFRAWQNRTADNAITKAIDAARRANDQRVDGVAGGPLPEAEEHVPLRRGRVRPAKGVADVAVEMSPHGASASGRLEAFEAQLRKRAEEGAPRPAPSTKPVDAPEKLPKPKRAAAGKSKVAEIKEEIGK